MKKATDVAIILVLFSQVKLRDADEKLYEHNGKN